MNGTDETLSRRIMRARVTGGSEDAADVAPQTLLHGRILTCSAAPARLSGIDVSKARALPGVVAVLTPADLPSLLTDRPRLAGEWIVAVAAQTALIAQDALALVDVGVEPLPIEAEPNRSPAMEAMVARRPGAIDVRFSGKTTRPERFDFHLRSVLAHPLSSKRDATEADALGALAQRLAEASGQPVRLTEPDLPGLVTRQALSLHRIEIEAGEDGIVKTIRHSGIENSAAGAQTISRPADIAGLAGPMHAADQVTFVLQQAVDMLAEACALDPLEVRLRNLSQDADGARMAACLRAGAERFGWARKWKGWRRTDDTGERYRQGVGLSIRSYGAREAPFAHQADFVEIEVDTQTGFAILIDHVCALDVTGLAAVPDRAALQTGFARSIGMTLMQPNPAEAAGGSGLSIPSVMDVFEATYVFTGVSAKAGDGRDPRDVGAADLAPAIANAVCDAVGVRLHSLPLSAEKILAALIAARCAHAVADRQSIDIRGQ